jgi:hypothetical protein
MSAIGTKRTKFEPRSEVRCWGLSRHWAYADNARYTDAFDSPVRLVISGTVAASRSSRISATFSRVSLRFRPNLTPRSRAFLMPSIWRLPQDCTEIS